LGDDAGDAVWELPGSIPSSILSALGQAVIGTDLHGLVRYWNDAARGLYKFAADEVIGRPLVEVIAPPGGEQLLREWSARLIAGDSYAGDWQVRDKTGRVFTTYVTLSPIRGPRDRVIGCVGLSHDVSVQREADVRARSLAAIVDGSDAAIIEAGPDRRIRSANPAVERLFGYPPQELIGRDVGVLVPEDGSADLADAVESVLAGRQVGLRPTRWRRKDGTLIDTTLRLSPVRDASGVIVGVSATTRDVSSEVATRVALEASERRYRSRFDNADMPQAFTDLEGRVTDLNEALCRLLGQRREECVGKQLRSLSHPTDRGVADQRLAAVAAGEVEADTYERVLARGDGWPLPVQVHATLVRQADGAPDCVAAFVQDLTALRDAESTLARREAKLEVFALRSSEWVLVLDSSGTLQYVSPSVGRLFGHDPEAITGQSGSDFMHPEDVAAARRGFDAVAATPGSSQTAEFRVIDADGRWHWVEQTFTNCADDADIGGDVCNGRDITARVVAEHALRGSEARYRAIAETAQEGIWAFDPSGRTLFANRKLADILGVSLPAVYQRPVLDLMNPHDLASTTEFFGGAICSAGELELPYAHPDESTHVLRVSASPLRGDADVVGSLAMISDVTEARRLEHELRHQALHDDLTGLPNRSLLTDRLEQAVSRLARREGGPVAVLFADLDHFKLVNDSWGHAVGDELLVRVGARLAGALRPGDSIARFGGDEFVVVCEQTSEVEACALASHLLATLAAPFDVAGKRVHINASIGIAVSPPQPASELLRFADAAMHDAKTRGRGRSSTFDAARAKESADRFQLSNDLRDALSDGDLTLHYQPIVELATGRVIGAEALARWQHPTRGYVSPAMFVGVAEMTGLANSLDRWAIEQACRDYASLADAFVGQPRIAVNISARHLTDPDFEGMVLSAVTASGVLRGGLVLEITENVMMDDPVHSAALLERLESRGIDATIDDFGTGYSSFSYLSRLPVKSMKIDRTFIEQIADDDDALAIAGSMIDLARMMDMTSVAEGVESVEQAAVLRQLGCVAAQGYLWSPAVPPADLVARLGALEGGHFDVVPGPAAVPPRSGARRDLVTDEHGLQRLMRLHRDGASLATIAAALNSMGYRTPRGLRWHSASVARVISDVAYPDLWSPTKEN
jgi:diguanylate cyclase (GGDEF)-like protein/PAS domain S-box-containing protein